MGYYLGFIIHHTKFTKTRRKHETQKDEKGEHAYLPLLLVRKSKICSAEVGRFQRPTRPPHEIRENQRNAPKGGRGWMCGRDLVALKKRSRQGAEA